MSGVIALLAVGMDGSRLALAADPSSVPPSIDIPEVQQGPKRSISLNDMATLRRVSRVANDRGDESRLTVSPDGSHVAFQLHQGDPETNAYRTAWFVAPVESPGRLTYVGDGGDATIEVPTNGVPTGEVVSLSAAKWSPDGRRIAYVRAQQGALELWSSQIDGKNPRRLTGVDRDVRSFAWKRDGSGLLVRVSRETRIQAHAAWQADASRGFLIDDRFWFSVSKEPLATARSDTATLIYDVASDTLRTPTSAENAEAQASASSSSWAVARISEEIKAADGPGSEANIQSWPQAPVLSKEARPSVAFARVLEPHDRAIYPSAVVAVVPATGAPRSCGRPQCKGMIRHIWWSDDGRVVYFEPQDENDTSEGIFAWDWRRDTVKDVFRSHAELQGCAFSKNRLICEYETLEQPDTIVAIDLRTGRLTPVADPNPEFRNIRLTEVERLEWTSRIDDASPDDFAFGYLVTPKNYRPGERYPLVILTKVAQGFVLQGGEYPAHFFADQGFLVFVCQEPFASLYRVGEAGRFRNDFQVRRHTQASLESGIETLEGRGLVDANRIALTGFSDGASLTYFALFRSHRPFAAAIVSSNNWEPVGYYLLPHYMRAGVAREMGITLAPDGPSAWFYNGEAPSRNVERINTPILQNLADSEVLVALPTIVTMEEFGKPVEGYVFSGEYHTKSQPAHLLSIWRRNTQWLQFWLQGVEAKDPVEGQQYARWEKLCDLQIANNPDRPTFCVPTTRR